MFGFWSPFLLALSLAMDCFAVSISQGIRTQVHKPLLILAICFGFFQGGMLFLGAISGKLLSSWLGTLMPWIAAALLFWIGGKMLYESQADEEPEAVMALSRTRDFILLSIATSIDAMAAGLSLQSLGLGLGISTAWVGLMSLLLALIGGFFGKRLGQKFGQKAEIFGGIILIGLGIKALI